MTDKILVPLADGFEEIEAVTIVDVLRRAGLDVTVAGLGSEALAGAHGLRLQPDARLDDLDLSTFNAIVLPGGMGGTLGLLREPRVLDTIRRLSAEGRLTAAICAAPMVLAEAGVVDGVPVTSHPSVRDRLGGADVRDGPRVVKADKVITSQGPGTAMEFALALVEELCGAQRARELADAMVVAAVQAKQSVQS